MNAATFLSAVVSVLLICCVGCSARRSPSVAGTESAAKGAPAPGAERISGPYTHENLTVFLVHGPDKLKAAKYLTLGEAMEQKKVIVMRPVTSISSRSRTSPTRTCTSSPATS